ncbi:MAG: membrane protein insertion efficiency factor YidD [Candidatus Moraniibacteriota bacterium]|nr:MAG: membrane protein insertion efficiency factor YidD [Candidatus Moranbacteria bacterium]
MKKFVLWLIRFYQRTLSLDHGLLSVIYSERLCRFHPSCSEYTYIAIERFGVIKGMWMGIKRISRCHPWNDGGVDFVPEKNHKM